MFRKGKSILLFLALCFIAIPAWSADWPRFYGPKGDGISLEKLPNVNWQAKQPKLLWKLDFNDESYSGPSVVGNRVYIVTHANETDIVKCLNIANGNTIWEYKYPNAGASNYGFTRATPSVTKDRLVTVSRWGLLVCLDPKNGKLIWTRDMVKEFGGKVPGWGYAASPLIDGNKVIVCPGGEGASVAALDLKTGKTIWQGGGSDRAAYSTPVKAKIQGVWQYVVLSARYLHGVGALDGKHLWEYEFKTNDGINIPMPIVLGNSVFITASYNMGSVLVGINPDMSVTEKWKNKILMAHFSTPILFKNYLYGVGDPGLLICLDPNDGTKKWAVEGFEKGPSLVVGEYLLTLVGNNGELVLSKPNPDKYTEICRMPTFGGQSWTAPVYTNGYLLIRNTKVFGCYDMR